MSLAPVMSARRGLRSREAQSVELANSWKVGDLKAIEVDDGPF